MFNKTNASNQSKQLLPPMCKFRFASRVLSNCYNSVFVTSQVLETPKVQGMLLILLFFKGMQWKNCFTL